MIALTAMNPPADAHKQPNTAAFVDETEFGIGNLFISSRNVIWISNDGMGFTLDYPKISMHAISRDTRNFPRPCIYMVVECEKTGGKRIDPDEFAEKLAVCNLKMDEAAPSTVGASAIGGDGDHKNGSTRDESDEEDEDDHSGIMEIRFAPADENALELIYQSLCDYQALHPDENESNSDEDFDGGENDRYGGASDEFNFDDHGQLVLNRMRGVRRDDGDDYDMEDEQEVEAAKRFDEEMEPGQFDDPPS